MILKSFYVEDPSGFRIEALSKWSYWTTDTKGLIPSPFMPTQSYKLHDSL